MSFNQRIDQSAAPQSVGIQVLRWIAVLPAALAAFIGIQLLIILGNAMTTPQWSDWWLQIVNSAASAYCFVIAGALTAPRYHRIVGIALAIIFGIFAVVIMTAGYFVKTKDPLWWLILCGAISLAAAITAVVKVHEEY